MKNTFIAWKAILNYGLVLSIIFTALVLVSYLVEPLVWVTDFPKEVQEQIGEIPREVYPLGWTIFLIFLALMITLPVLMNQNIFKDLQDKATFLNLALNAFLLLNFMNLFDAVVVDILIFGVIQPGFMWIEGAEEYIKEHVTLAFHFIAFLKGQPYLLVIALIAAAISWYRLRNKHRYSQPNHQQ